MENHLLLARKPSRQFSSVQPRYDACATLLANQRGQSLVQVLISIGLMGILMASFATMTANQSRETQALSEKLAAMDFQQQLIRSFADGKVCTSLLNNLTLNTSGMVLNVTGIPVSTTAPPGSLAKAGQAPSPLSSTLVVDANNPFQVTNIASAGTNLYSGVFQVGFDKTRLVRALQPAQTQITITTNGGTTITGCQSTSSSFGGLYGYTNWNGSCQSANIYTGSCSCPSWAPIDQTVLQAIDGIACGGFGCVNHPVSLHLCHN